MQGPAGTRGPEGRQGEKGAKVRPVRGHTVYVRTYTCKRVVSVGIYRETQVPWAPQVKRALWDPRECQENLELKVFAGCQDQWSVPLRRPRCQTLRTQRPTSLSLFRVSKDLRDLQDRRDRLARL